MMYVTAEGSMSPGGEAHGRVDNLAVLDGGYGRSVAYMTGDDLQVLDVLSFQFSHTM